MNLESFFLLNPILAHQTNKFEYLDKKNSLAKKNYLRRRILSQPASIAEKTQKEYAYLVLIQKTAVPKFVQFCK